ncbi:histidine kinase [Coralloluteibacterium thermophilus]|uniref:Histidine kinase n=1 Tax=Coralloluteibacterium thermophilum TaxID=2707049 RepID=A0ABV9NIA7_9GAMM
MPTTDPRLAPLLEERAAVSRALHDDIGQALTAAVLELQFSGTGPVDAETRDAVVAELKAAIARLRDISLRLAKPPGATGG